MSERKCQLTGKLFQYTPQEEALSKQLGVPLGTLCSEERFRRMLAFVPGKHLFYRSCDATGKRIFSVYTSKALAPVYAPSYYYSSEWNPLSFGKAFDFKRLFAEQLTEISTRVPRPAFRHIGSEATRVSHSIEQVHSCFLLFNSSNCERCYCSVGLRDCGDCLDCYFLADCQSCYDCSHCEASSRLRFSEFSTNCHNSWFLSNCVDCEHCFMCCNLEGKKYCYQNKQLSESEYFARLDKLEMSSRPKVDNARNEFLEFLEKQPLPYILQKESLSCSGNYLRRCVGVEECYSCNDVANSAVGMRLLDCANCLECVDGTHLRNCVRCVDCRNCENLINCIECHSLKDSSYSVLCSDGSNLFGCVGLSGKSHCIFNVQFEPEDYQNRVQEIRKHLVDRNVWGHFFSPSLSPFGYNHTEAMEQMPLTRIPAQMMGYRWEEEEEGFRTSLLLGSSESEGSEIFSDMPDDLSGIGTAVLEKRVFICELRGKPFQITSEELRILQDLGTVPPVLCFQERHALRLKRLAVLQLSEKECADSGNAVRTAFGSKWKQRIVANIPN